MLSVLKCCTSLVQSWMAFNFLQLKSDKTELLLVPPCLVHLFKMMKPCFITLLVLPLLSFQYISPPVVTTIIRSHIHILLLLKLWPKSRRKITPKHNATNITHQNYCNHNYIFIFLPTSWKPSSPACFLFISTCFQLTPSSNKEIKPFQSYTTYHLTFLFFFFSFFFNYRI